MSSDYKTKKIDDDSDDVKNDVDVEKIDVNIQNSSEMKAEKSNIKTDDENNNSQIAEIKDTNEGNTTNSSVPWYKNKKYQKIGLFAIIGVVICALVIVLAVCLSKKNKSKNPPHQENNLIFNYKISTLYFNSVKDETIKTILEDIKSDSKNRRLSEKKNIKTIKTDYLFAIVSVPNNVVDYYTGYVLMLKREEKLDGNYITKSFDDLDNINNDKSYNGVMRVKYKGDGTILEIVGQKDLNELYYNEINDTITCLIPRIIVPNDERNLYEVYNGNNNYSEEPDTNENKTSYLNNINGRLGLNDSALIGSEYYADINITIEKGNYKQMTFNKRLLIQNGEYEKSVDSSLPKNKTFMGDEIDDDITVNGLIQSVETISNQTLNYERDDGEELAIKYKNKLEKFEFSENKLSSANRLRVLSNEEYEENLKLQNELGNNLNNLRDLAELGEVTQSLYFPLIFNYEIFKMNVLGLQMALRARIDWIPSEGYIMSKISFQRGNKIIELVDNSTEIKN